MSSLETAADDLLRFHAPPAARDAYPAYLLIGSERGFCGDFNEAVARALAA